MAENVEHHRHTGLKRVRALHHRIVDLRSALDVVALDGQELLENVGGAVRFQAPDFHFSEPLPAGTSLAAERLLRNERVGARRTSVNFVIHQMVELEHVHVADGRPLFERLTAAAIMKLNLAVDRHVGEEFPRMARVLASLLEGVDLALDVGIGFDDRTKDLGFGRTIAHRVD